MLDNITADDEKKQELLQGEVIDKAEKLSEQLATLYINVAINADQLSRASEIDTRKARTVSRSTKTAPQIKFTFLVNEHAFSV